MVTEQAGRTDAETTAGGDEPMVVIDLIRRRLTERAFLFEDHNAYRGGVEDALREVSLVLVEDDES
ncbi:MAG: hypothetical protein R3320_03795 [Nitriliruptorales bacterium]|nr:hypothetical protein [Nitriliruptorales bacterium]